MNSIALPRNVFYAATCFALVASLLLLFGRDASPADAHLYDTFSGESYCTIVYDPVSEVFGPAGSCSYTPGNIASTTTSFNVPVTGSNFGGVRVLSHLGTFTLKGTDMPLGAILGDLVSSTRLALLGTACNQPVAPTFRLINGTTDFIDGAGTAVDRNLLIFPEQPGFAKRELNMRQDRFSGGGVMAGGTVNTQQAHNPHTQTGGTPNGIPDSDDHFPSFILPELDPDFQTVGPDGIYEAPTDVYAGTAGTSNYNDGAPIVPGPLRTDTSPLDAIAASPAPFGQYTDLTDASFPTEASADGGLRGRIIEFTSGPASGIGFPSPIFRQVYSQSGTTIRVADYPGVTPGPDRTPVAGNTWRIVRDDVDGPLMPIEPYIHLGGNTNVVDEHIFLHFFGFKPNENIAWSAVEAQGGGVHTVSQIESSWGWPVLSILTDLTPTATAPSAIHDFCTPVNLGSHQVGQTGDNPCTPTPAGGWTSTNATVSNGTYVGGTCVVDGSPFCSGQAAGLGPTGIQAFCPDGQTPATATGANGSCNDVNSPPCPDEGLPGAIGAITRNQVPDANTGWLNTNTHVYWTYNLSLRSPDTDNWENNLDTCPYSNDADDPRDPASLGADTDSINSCDENAGAGNTDIDGPDGFANRQDNCPQVPNGTSVAAQLIPNQYGAGDVNLDTDLLGPWPADGGVKANYIGDACDAFRGASDSATDLILTDANADFRGCRPGTGGGVPQYVAGSAKCIAGQTPFNTGTQNIIGCNLRYLSGPALGQNRSITAATATTITVGTAFNPAPTAGGLDSYITLCSTGHYHGVASLAPFCQEPGTPSTILLQLNRAPPLGGGDARATWCKETLATLNSLISPAQATVTAGAETACTDAVDSDGDGFVNDGCPQVGSTAEAGGQCTNATNDDSGDDSVVNDGCPIQGISTTTEIYSTTGAFVIGHVGKNVCMVSGTIVAPLGQCRAISAFVSSQHVTTAAFGAVPPAGAKFSVNDVGAENVLGESLATHFKFKKHQGLDPLNQASNLCEVLSPANACPAQSCTDGVDNDGDGNIDDIGPDNACNQTRDSDGDGFSDFNELRNGSDPRYACTVFKHAPADSGFAGVHNAWPVDLRPAAGPNRLVDTAEVSLLLGFVGKAPGSVGYTVRYDIKLDNSTAYEGVIDTGEISIILGFVGRQCTQPPG